MALADASARARAAHPEIELDETLFAARVAELAAFDELHAPDLWLAIACIHDDPKALEILEGRFLPDVAVSVRTIDSSPAFVDDVLQQLRAKLFVDDGLASYAGQGPLAAWLRIVALRIAIDMRRNDWRHVAIEDRLVDDADPARSPEEQLARRQHAALIERALRETIAQQSSRTRALLRYHYGDRVANDELAAIYNVHASTISRWLVAAREAILVGTRRVVARELAISADEVDRLLGLAHSLEVSLHSLLASG